ncbi:MAG TPA: cell division protein ZapA [Epulopiscium sp.]|nr:cell division protein ZapA [Candidatus Epulonipiscium sp.]
MEKKNKIEVIIGGALYVLQGNESIEHMQRVASYIDSVIRDVKKLDISNRMSTTQVAMLTSINIADDFLKAENRIKEQDLENNGFYNEFNKLEKENAALKDKISELQIELTRLRLEAK